MTRSLLLCGAGFALGIAVAEVRPRPPEPIASVVVERVPAPRAVACPERAPVAAPEPDPRLAWCEQQLRALTTPVPTGRLPWPDEVPDAESPQAWSDAVDAVVGGCDLSGRAVSTDCEEYPCVTLIQPSVDPAEVVDQHDVCDVQVPGVEVTLVPAGVTCPDGSRREMLVMLGYSEEGIEAAAGRPGDEIPFSEYVLHAGRRVESALGSWDCGPP